MLRMKRIKQTFPQITNELLSEEDRHFIIKRELINTIEINLLTTSEIEAQMITQQNHQSITRMISILSDAFDDVIVSTQPKKNKIK